MFNLCSSFVCKYSCANKNNFELKTKKYFRNNTYIHVFIIKKDRSKKVALNSLLWKLLPLCKKNCGASRCECGAFRYKEKSGKTLKENKFTNKQILDFRAYFVVCHQLFFTA